MRLAAAVILALVVLRPLWLFPAAAAARAMARRRDAGVPAGWRETAVDSWAGMRGVVTVATALALPSSAEEGAPLPWRESVVLVGLSCVLVTLVVQGLTLTPLVQRLGVGSDTDEAGEVSELKTRALRAAADALRAAEAEGPGGRDPAYQAALLRYEGYLRAHEAIGHALDAAGADATGGGEGTAGMTDRFLAALRRGIDAEREVVLRAPATGDVTPPRPTRSSTTSRRALPGRCPDRAGRRPGRAGAPGRSRRVRPAAVGHQPPSTAAASRLADRPHCWRIAAVRRPEGLSDIRSTAEPPRPWPGSSRRRDRRRGESRSPCQQIGADREDGSSRATNCRPLFSSPLRTVSLPELPIAPSPCSLPQGASRPPAAVGDRQNGGQAGRDALV